MKYTDYINAIPLGSCPFCASDDRRLIENKTAYVTYALAPYHKHHLLIIPKEHRKSFLHLSPEEHIDIQDLAQKSARLLRYLGYEDFTLMVREGIVSGISLDHLHYHFIPNVRLADLDHANGVRNVMSDDEVRSLVVELRNAIDRL
ncbi:MAG: HIT family protein [Candidatus Moraniibacteriota bacterium]